MLKKVKKLIVTYHTSNMAFATEKICKEQNVAGELISAPRALSSDCGISFATDVVNKEKLKYLLDDFKIEYEKIVELEI